MLNFLSCSKPWDTSTIGQIVSAVLILIFQVLAAHLMSLLNPTAHFLAPDRSGSDSDWSWRLNLLTLLDSESVSFKFGALFLGVKHQNKKVIAVHKELLQGRVRLRAGGRQRESERENARAESQREGGGGRGGGRGGGGGLSSSVCVRPDPLVCVHEKRKNKRPTKVTTNCETSSNKTISFQRSLFILALLVSWFSESSVDYTLTGSQIRQQMGLQQ